jgi:hypothetical protein
MPESTIKSSTAVVAVLANASAVAVLAFNWEEEMNNRLAI